MSGVNQLEDAFGDVAALNSVLALQASPLTSTTSLMVRTQYYLWRTEFEFALAGQPMTGTVDLWYETQNAAFGSLFQPTSARDSEFSFKVKADNDGRFSGPVLRAARDLLSALQSSDWVAAP